MKYTINKKISDPIAEMRKNKEFSEFSSDSKMRLNFGIEVYNKRKELGLSQQKFAKKIKSTQKVISNIENGAVDLQSSTINKVNTVLKLTAESWSRIYGFQLPTCKIIAMESLASRSNKPLPEYKQIQVAMNATNNI